MASRIDLERRAAFSFRLLVRAAAFAAAMLVATGLSVQADEPSAGKGDQQAAKPIKALLVTGGCCHDYDRQKLIIPKGVSARANVEWTVVQQGGTTTDTRIPLYDDPDWADGYDIVVHNECFAGVGDKEFVERILKPHREGLPAVLIHCAMHCYRTGDDAWFEFCGLQSPNHGPHYAYTIDNRAPDSPIMQGFGESWSVPKGELYNSVKLWPTCKPLATANRQPDGQPQTCVWTNEYGKARVFATTVGHYNETMADPKYLDMLTRGILWACGRDVEQEFTKTDAATDEAIKALVAANRPGGENPAVASTPCCGAGNLLAGKQAKASSEETGKNNFAKNAIDGNLSTRWCASSSAPNQTWEVDLGAVQPIKSLRIHWEGNAAYKYKVDFAKQGGDWTTVVDQADNRKVQRITEHVLDAPAEAQKLRVTYLGSNTGAWGSIWEIEAYSAELPQLPEGADRPGGKPAAPGISDVTAPPEFEVSLFGAPPEINYPACLAAAVTGEVYVGVDPQGSLGKKPDEGKILRCRDIDGDGVADEIKEFARVDHPRGLIVDGDKVWCLHPPFLSVLTDEDGDGVAEDRKVLVSGISTPELVEKRGADHTTNGIHLGIDGWIYVAVGDFGLFECTGTDGTKISKKGGGVLRVRPDGSEMEVYAWGLRNIYDVCIDPTLNIFTRDNTNDGGGWNVRVSHIMQSAEYGYPTHYDRFAEETFPPLADYGGGSGCGGMYIHDTRLPGVFGDAAYTCDWGRSEVYRHNFPQAGATFAPHQKVFVKIPRPTDIAIDGSGLIYVASWKNGNFGYDGENVGFVAQLRPVNFAPKPAPDFAKLSNEELIAQLSGPSAVLRLAAQRELLRRGENEATVKALYQRARDAEAPLYGRVAAIFTLKAMLGERANEGLARLVEDASIREWALRALTDRKSELAGVTKEPFVAALTDENARVRAQALISLGRLGDASAAEAILPLTVRPADQPLPSESPFHAQPDPARVIPHLAVRALVALGSSDKGAVDVALAGLDGTYRAGALQALRYLHSQQAVDGVAQRLKSATDEPAKQELLDLLVRLHSREGAYKGDWWGTRPDHSGPYYDAVAWEGTAAVAQALGNAYRSGAPETRNAIATELARLKVKLDGIEVARIETMDENATPISLPKTSNDPRAILNLSYEDAFQAATKAAGDATRGKELFATKQCNACHTDAEGQSPKGPHLVDIGKRYKRAELVESILRPSAKLAQGFESWAFVTSEGKVVNGFVVSESASDIEIRLADGKAVRLAKEDVETRKKIETSVMPEGLVGDLTPERLADLLAYLESLKKD